MLLKSINYWSFPGGLDGTYPITLCLEEAARHGFEAVELCIGAAGELNVDSGEDVCSDILRHAERVGIRVASVASGLYWSHALGDESPQARAQAASELTRMIRITGLLGARTLLTIPGAVDVFFQPERPALSYEGVWERATDGLAPLLPLAESLGVTLGVENVWNKFLLSPLEMARFIDQFNSPAIGAYVDVANILPYGYPEQWLRVLGPRVVGIHFKDFRRAVGTIEGFVDLLEGDVPWPDVMRAIGEIGYDGPVVAEMIPLYRHYPAVRIANTSRAMNAILGR